MSASPDDSFWFTIVGFMMTLSGGLAAGSAHHRVSEELHRRGEERLREQSLAKVQADTAVGASKLESELRDLESRRRALTAELDSLDQEPEKRATDEEELRRIKESHLADGAYYYNLGANFAGRPPVVEKVVDNA
jgi:TolA-binding protein